MLNIYFPQLKGKLFFIHSMFSYDTIHRDHKVNTLNNRSKVFYIAAHFDP